MAKVTIEFPSVELANLFASTISGGEFSKMMNELSESCNHPEQLEDYLEDRVKWDEREQGNHIIDISEDLKQNN